MGLAEELADKYRTITDDYGDYTYLEVELVAAINEAIERCAERCDGFIRPDYGTEPYALGYRTAQRTIAERIRALKS